MALLGDFLWAVLAGLMLVENAWWILRWRARFPTRRKLKSINRVSEITPGRPFRAVGTVVVAPVGTQPAPCRALE